MLHHNFFSLWHFVGATESIKICTQWAISVVGGEPRASECPVWSWRARRSHRARVKKKKIKIIWNAWERRGTPPDYRQQQDAGSVPVRPSGDRSSQRTREPSEVRTLTRKHLKLRTKTRQNRIRVYDGRWMDAIGCSPPSNRKWLGVRFWTAPQQNQRAVLQREPIAKSRFTPTIQAQLTKIQFF